MRSPVDADELMARGVWWASEVIGFSSEYSSTANAAAGVRFAPDVYPRHGDIAGAWASSATDGGEEWIEVRFASPVAAVSVLWLETFNAGLVVAHYFRVGDNDLGLTTEVAAVTSVGVEGGRRLA